MNKITKKSAFGVIGVAAAGLLALGAAAPAMASTTSHHDSGSSYSSASWTKSYTHLVGDISNETPVVVAPQLGVGDVLGGGILNGGVANGDIADGNAVASGNDVSAPVATGNTIPVALGNDTSVANGSGNGNSVGTSVSHLVNVDGIVGGILDSVDLNAILQGR